MMSSVAPPIFDSLSALADTTRSRLLLLLERHELGVGELCAILQLPQSTVSRHLKTLSNDGWVRARAEGTSRWYRMATERLDPADRRLWELVREQIAATAAAEQDRARLGSVLEQRRIRSKEFFSTAAGEWDALRGELFGSGAELWPLFALADERWTVGDLGCGTGGSSVLLAPFVRRVVAVDDSPAMLDAARTRLDRLENVEVRNGELTELPLDDGELDAAILSLVLHHVAEPIDALREVRRVLHPGGRIVIMDMMPHDREEFRERMGHAWLGFGEEQLGAWLAEAGFESFRYQPLPLAPEAKGPALFAATGKRMENEERER